MSANATSKAIKKKAAARPKALKTRAVVAERVSLGRGEEGRRMALGYARVVRTGRPKKGETAVGTSVRSLRLYNPEWQALEDVAAERGMSTHAAMREAVVQWLARAGAKNSKR